VFNMMIEILSGSVGSMEVSDADTEDDALLISESFPGRS